MDKSSRPAAGHLSDPDGDHKHKGIGLAQALVCQIMTSANDTMPEAQLFH